MGAGRAAGGGDACQYLDGAAPGAVSRSAALGAVVEAAVAVAADLVGLAVHAAGESIGRGGVQELMQVAELAGGGAALDAVALAVDAELKEFGIGHRGEIVEAYVVGNHLAVVMIPVEVVAFSPLAFCARDRKLGGQAVDHRIHLTMFCGADDTTVGEVGGEVVFDLVRAELRGADQQMHLRGALGGTAGAVAGVHIQREGGLAGVRVGGFVDVLRHAGVESRGRDEKDGEKREGRLHGVMVIVGADSGQMIRRKKAVALCAVPQPNLCRWRDRS